MRLGAALVEEVHPSIDGRYNCHLRASQRRRLVTSWSTSAYFPITGGFSHAKTSPLLVPGMHITIAHINTVHADNMAYTYVSPEPIVIPNCTETRLCVLAE